MKGYGRIMQTSVRAIGYMAALGAVFLWAGNFVVARAVAADIAPFTMNFLRWIMAFFCVLPLALRKKDLWREDVRIARENLPYMALMGAIGVTFLNALFYKAGQSTSSINMVLFVPSAPIVILLLSRIFCGEAITTRQIFGLITILAGLALLLSRGSWENLVNVHFNIGDLWSLAGVTCFGLYSFLARYRPKGMSTFGFHTFVFFLGLVLMLPLFLMEFFTHAPPQWNISTIFGVFYAGIGCSFVAYVLWTVAIDRIGPVAAGMIYYSIPLFTALEGVFFLGENVTLVHVVGACLMLAGIFLAILQKHS